MSGPRGRKHRARTGAACVAASLALAVAPRLAHAQTSNGYAFDYETSVEARPCGDAARARAQIAERMGRDPFVPEGAPSRRVLRVRVTRDRGRWRAEIVLVDGNGAVAGKRVLDEGGATCDALSRSLVFTIAVVLEEPMVAPTPEGAPAAPSPALTAPAAPPAPEPSPFAENEKPTPPAPAPDSPRIMLDAAAGALGALGLAPAPSAGFEALMAASRERWRVELGARATLPSSEDAAVSVRTRLVVGRVAPCWGPTWASGCFVVLLGNVSGEATGAGVAKVELAGTFYGAAGIGIVSRVPLGSVMFARLAVEALTPFSRTGFDVGSVRVWSLAPVAATASVGLGARLP